MTDHVDLMPTSSPRKPRIRYWLRAAGVAAVIASGWCGWLATSVTPPPQEIEAYHDWNDVTPAPHDSSEPQPLPTTSSRRLSAEITDVTPVAGPAEERDAVVFALQVEDSAESTGTIEVVGHASDQPSHEAVSSGAWLTGAIDDEDPQAEAASENLSQVPAWKRTSRSTKRSHKTASTPIEPRQ